MVVFPFVVCVWFLLDVDNVFAVEFCIVDYEFADIADALPERHEQLAAALVVVALGVS
jgi:hypothetical protein